MGNVSSTKSRLEITEVDRAILSLKTQRRRLEDYRARALAQIDHETQVAHQLIASGRKDRATLALKRRKLHERAVENADSYLLNVETMLSNVELAKNQANVVATLKQGAQALQQIQKAVTLEDVERLQEETEEARTYQAQLKQLLGESLSGEDDRAIEEEVQALERELITEEMAKFPTVPVTRLPEAPGKQEILLPEVPTHLPVPPAKTEEPLFAS